MSSRRKSLTFSRRTQSGATPGTLRPAANAITPVINIIAYSETGIVEKNDISVSEIADLRAKYSSIWLDISGLGDVETIQAIGDMFGFHRLALEDVFNVHQRPKLEEFDNHLFIVARMVIEGEHLDTEQIALFLGEGYLVTFQEFPEDCLDPIRDRLRKNKGRIRRTATDYLCYTILDAILDDYFPVLEKCGETLEHIEDRLITHPNPGHVKELHNLKRDLLVLRRAVWPHREMINALIRGEHPLIVDPTRIYLRDCYDHTIQLMDIVETYREIASGLVDVYISAMSAKLNEIMKVLAIIGTIFMPLSFIVGYYGMNFDTTASPWNMPELGWRFGNLFALFLMLATTAAMLWYFWRNNWIRPFWRRDRE